MSPKADRPETGGMIEGNSRITASLISNQLKVFLMATMPDEPQRCPRCGSFDIVVTENYDNAHRFVGYHLKCNECGYEGDFSGILPPIPPE